MEIITITAYRGLSVVSGSIDIRKLFEFIRGCVYRDKIRRLRETMETGDTAKADRMKTNREALLLKLSNEEIAYLALETPEFCG